MNTTTVHIEEWLSNHPRWNEVVTLIERLGQTRWVAFDAAWHISTHVLVAFTSEHVIGFLRYVIQDIGAEEAVPPITRNGTILREAKVIAFGVAPDKRRQGIGGALQT
ncbi:MAG: hypothetical protein GFH27_549357n73 [Chloroflexi bacterium AL-W]|nr:hypothetical protein [Chloroflexi bacterium AL-N10]NOK78529.1 hypothetical protein [Chloroflexi bacterium AL-N5]NOK85613.1 hypothetical protein [Chloroflexi bacterium AL-W]NOK92527.1 hypothetical protein [Chloroflexi bacterium AL-N15]